MRRFSISCAALSFALAGNPALAQSDAQVDYKISFPNAVHHEAEIAISFTDLELGPLTVQMSRASPGRYAIHEFAKNVYNVQATAPDGRPLTVSQTTPFAWVITGHSGAANVSYTLYADRADGTYSQIDLTHAHLNAPATWMWAKGLEDRPVQVRFTPPNRDWDAATQLVATRRAMTFRAPDLQYFMDSPVELSNQDIRSWRLADGQTVRMAVHHDGLAEDVSEILGRTKRVVAEQIKIFGEAPQFDHGVYTFLADYVGHASRDGMEHRNSTVLTRPDGLHEADFAHLGTISHEFFHAWNVERIRPADLEPFDFTDANPSQSLWFAEGFTSYYGPLTIRRAGEQSLDDYVGDLGGTLSRILNAPGRTIRGPAGMSLRAPFVDASTSIDPTNNANTFVSYYPYGAMIALALDLTLRGEFEGVTLDDFMKLVWTKYGKTETPYTNDDLRATLAELTGDSAFARNFFARYIDEGQLPDYAPLLARAGLTLERAGGDAWIGNATYAENGKAVTIRGNTLRGSPLYKAGLDRGDQIIRIGRFKIESEGSISRALGRYDVGDVVSIEFVQRGVTRIEQITLAEDPARMITIIDDPTPAQLAFRASWLGAED